jgi:hypothetical protein
MTAGGRHPDGDRTRYAAAILPFAATILFMPPLLGVFAGPLAPAGIPLIIIYLFAVWAAIVVAAFLLARRLSHRAADDAYREPPDAGDPR